MKHITTTTISMSVLTTLATAGTSTPNVWGEMEHIMITLDNGAIHAHVDTNAANPIELHRFAGEIYDGAAGVLNDSYYSSQYGWVADGFISLNPDEFIWIEMTTSSASLDVYEGGMRMMRHMHTYSAIQGTDGSDNAWMWGGTMVHNWYSADTLGDYAVTYEIFVGDANADAVTGYTSDLVTLNFNTVPTPAGLSLIGLGGLIVARRNRGES